MLLQFIYSKTTTKTTQSTTPLSHGRNNPPSPQPAAHCSLTLSSRRFSFLQLGVASLPLLVPILLVLTAAAVIGGLAAGAVWAGSRSGRPWLQRAIRPVYDKVGKADPEVGGVWRRLFATAAVIFLFLLQIKGVEL